MFKRLAIFALLILGCPYLARPQAPRGGSKENQPTQQEAAQPQLIHPPPTTTQVQFAPTKQQSKPDQKPAGYPWKELLTPANIPNWVLCIVGGVAGWAAVKTLRTIKHQAHLMDVQTKHIAGQLGQMANQTEILDKSVAAAQKSADAALDQIQMMKERERARISVKPVRLQKLDFNFADFNNVMLEIENFGPTHAFNVRGDGDSRAIVKGFGAPDIDFNSLSIPDVIRAGETHSAGFCFFFEEDWFEIRKPNESDIAIELIGTIKYNDVFGEPHETAFSYITDIQHLGELNAETREAEILQPWGWRKALPDKNNRAS